MKIKSIEFPNTVKDDEQTIYTVGFTRSSLQVDEIKCIQKNGEMAAVNWFQVIKDGKVYAEIKESVCNVYYA